MNDEMCKVIFLDIDGVLNTIDDQSYRYLKRKEEAKAKNTDASDKSLTFKTRDCYGHLFSQRAVEWLDYIIMATGAKIVISSTWRLSGIDVMRGLWMRRKLPGEIISVTPSHRSRSFVNNYKGTDFEDYRGIEIEAWLKNHPEVSRYVILDDECDMLPDQDAFFVKTDQEYGITGAIAESVLEILNN